MQRDVIFLANGGIPFRRSIRSRLSARRCVLRISPSRLPLRLTPPRHTDAYEDWLKDYPPRANDQRAYASLRPPRAQRDSAGIGMTRAWILSLRDFLPGAGGERKMREAFLLTWTRVTPTWTPTSRSDEINVDRAGGGSPDRSRMEHPLPPETIL